jgi:hypothetical protein
MAAFTLKEAQDNLIGIINSVEAGVMTPEAAVEELERLKEDAPSKFTADWTLEDFQTVRDKAASSSYDDYDNYDDDDNYIRDEETDEL